MTIQKPDGKIEITERHRFNDGDCVMSHYLPAWRTKRHPLWMKSKLPYAELRAQAIGSETVAEFVKAMEKPA